MILAFWTQNDLKYSIRSKENRVFKERVEAGQLVTKELTHFKDERDILIRAIPRGGVVVT
jgi:hypothetical protein